MRTIYPAILIAIVALTAEADTMPVNGLTMDANGMRAGDKLSREMLSFSPDMLCDTLKSWDFFQVPSEDTVRVTHYNRFGENLVVENENGENRLSYNVRKLPPGEIFRRRETGQSVIYQECRILERVGRYGCRTYNS